jgi:glutaminyl-peptide cyclotransferase
MRLFLVILAASMSIACTGSANNTPSNTNKSNQTVPTYSFKIVNTYPHDQSAYTQGLVVYNGFFYEGTGGRRSDTFHSSLRKVEVQTGKVLQKFDLAGEYFGEGITILNNKIYQLTWQENKAFVYDVNDFKLLKEFSYSTEGWGLTHDGTNLIMSDGSHLLRFKDPETFEEIRSVPVVDEKGRPVVRLNELEYVKGEIWANVFTTGWIVRIDPATGKIVGRIDLNEFAEEQMESASNADVLNGIAYDAASDRIYITGKQWKKLFEITVTPKQ